MPLHYSKINILDSLSNTFQKQILSNKILCLNAANVFTIKSPPPKKILCNASRSHHSNHRVS